MGVFGAMASTVQLIAVELSAHFDIATSPHQMALRVLASVIKPVNFRPISSKQLFCSLRVGIAFEYDFYPGYKPGFLLIGHRVEGKLLAGQRASPEAVRVSKHTRPREVSRTGLLRST